MTGVHARGRFHLEPGQRAVVASFGRFGQLQMEIARRIGADLRVIQAPWGAVFAPEQIEAAIKTHRPRLLAICREDNGQDAPLGVNYFADTGPFDQAGVQAVLFGPGDIAQAHTADEWIELPQLAQAQQLLRRWLALLP